MAGDWVKMRSDLYRDPKVSAMADALLEMSPRNDSCNALRNVTVTEHNVTGRYTGVTRNVMRNAVVGALCSVWGVIRTRGTRYGTDLVLSIGTLESIDDMADIEGFGEAMESVGWVVVDGASLVFPRFCDDSPKEPDDKAREANRLRQRRHRERKDVAKSNGDGNALHNVTHNALHNVTVTPREREKREREEKETNTTPLPPSPNGKGEVVPSSVNPASPAEEPKRRAKPFDAIAAVASEPWSDKLRDAWADWVAHRREKRAPLTPTTVANQAKAFSEWGESRAIAAIAHTIRMGWQGLREPDTETGSRAGPGPKVDPMDELREKLEAAKKHFAEKSKEALHAS